MQNPTKLGTNRTGIQMAPELSQQMRDHDGWELLIRLAGEMGNADMVASFRRALAEETVHLDTVRGWYESATLATARLI